MQTYTPTPIDYLLISLFLMVMFSIWNGLVNKQLYQDTTPERKRATSKAWHKVGVMVRLGLGLIAFLAYSHMGALLAVIFAYPVYDRLMNLVRGLPFNHYGKSKFDQITKKYKLDWAVLIICLLLIALEALI